MIIGIGSDLIDIRRVEKSLERFGARFTERCCTEIEQAKSDGRKNRAASYAKRFAAKEACSKALGTGLAQGVFWKLEYAYDFSRPGRDGRPIASELSVRKCPGLDLDWKDPEGLGRFGPLICDDDPEAFRRSAHEALL